MSIVDSVCPTPPIPCSTLVDYVDAELELSVAARFAKVMRCVPQEQLAYCGEDGALTYAELDQQSDHLARILVESIGCKATMGHQKAVALLLPHTAASLIGILGVLKTGHFYVPLAPEQGPAYHAQIIGDCPPVALVTTTALLPQAQSLFAPLTQVPILLIDDLPVCQTVVPPFAEISPQAIAIVLYTSGSTGQPRGVMRTHRQLLSSAYLSAQDIGVGSTSHVAHLMSFAFAGSTMFLYGALLNGATLHALLPREFTSAMLYQWLLKQQITVLGSVPAILRGLTVVADKYPPLAAMNTIYIGGETINRQDVARIAQILPANGRVVCALSSTEVGNYARFILRADIPWEGERVPAGYANDHVQLTLIDSEGRPVEPNTEGQICVRSLYLSPGYWNQPALTAAKFLPDPEGGERRIFLTGDLGRMTADGLLEHLGRIDFMVKIRGFRVEPETVEKALMTHPALCECVVVARPSRSGESRLIAYLVVRSSPGPSVRELRALLAQSLPDYMIPARFMVIENLPRNANGKIDRQKLPALGAIRPDLASPFVAPSTELAQQLADMWAELLELDEVGINDNLFELGGDSLTAMHIVFKVNEQYRHRLSLDFFRNPTVTRLAQLIAGEAPLTQSAPPPTPTAHQHSSLLGQLRGVSSPRSLLRMMDKGPLLRGHALPYSIGVRLHQQWINLPLVRQSLQTSSTILQDWLALLGRADPNGQAQELSQLANTWRAWRNQCLLQPVTFAKWVTARNPNILDDVLATGRPVIFLAVHTAIYNTAARIMIEQRSPRPLWGLSYSPTGHADAVTKLMKAREILLQKGLVLVLGDGGQGTKGIELSLCGQPWLFRTGAAELALDTDAILLPVFTTLARTGQITVECLPPLHSSGQTKQDQIEDLTRQYATLLSTHWPSLISTMKWDKLHQIMNYSAKGTK